MKIKSYLVVMLILSLVFIVSACSPAESESTGAPPLSESEGLPPVAAIKAREALAAELGLEIQEVTILAQEQAEWSDSCLGLGGAAESCLMVIVSGWKVELSAEGQTYIARTDEFGDVVRFEP